MAFERAAKLRMNIIMYMHISVIMLANVRRIG